MSLLLKTQGEFLLDYCKLVQFAVSHGFEVTAGELLRPVQMQEIYVKTGRSKTMDSYHIKKLAGDLNFFKDGKYVCNLVDIAPIGAYWESLNPNNHWGGRFSSFKDVPHFERHL